MLHRTLNNGVEMPMLGHGRLPDPAGWGRALRARRPRGRLPPHRHRPGLRQRGGHGRLRRPRRREPAAHLRPRRPKTIAWLLGEYVKKNQLDGGTLYW